MINWMFYVIIETGHSTGYETGEYAFYHIDIKCDYERLEIWCVENYAGKYQLGVF